MKKLFKYLFLFSAVLFAACSSTYQARTGYVDDVYYSKKTVPHYTYKKVKVNSEIVQSSEEASVKSSEEDSVIITDDVQYVQNEEYQSQDTIVESYSEADEDGNTYITNNYYNNDIDDFYDYTYASRLRRFHYPYLGFSYYDDYYTNLYWYNYNPYYLSMSFYSMPDLWLLTSTSWYRPYYGWGFGYYGHPFYNYGWEPYYYGYGYYGYGNFWHINYYEGNNNNYFYGPRRTLTSNDGSGNRRGGRYGNPKDNSDRIYQQSVYNKRDATTSAGRNVNNKRIVPDNKERVKSSVNKRIGNTALRQEQVKTKTVARQKPVKTKTVARQEPVKKVNKTLVKQKPQRVKKGITNQRLNKKNTNNTVKRSSVKTYSKPKPQRKNINVTKKYAKPRPKYSKPKTYTRPSYSRPKSSHEYVSPKYNNYRRTNSSKKSGATINKRSTNSKIRYTPSRKTPSHSTPTRSSYSRPSTSRSSSSSRSSYSRPSSTRSSYSSPSTSRSSSSRSSSHSSSSGRRK